MCNHHRKSTLCSDLNQNQMTDLQREKSERDERAKKTPVSEETQRQPQANLRRDDDSKTEEKNRGTANSDMGKKDSNVGRSSTSGNLGSQTPNRSSTGTSQTPGKDSGANKGINQPGMKR
jgi:hypothetical protein